MSTIEKALAKKKENQPGKEQEVEQAQAQASSPEATVENQPAQSQMTQQAEAGGQSVNYLEVDTEDLDNRGFLIDTGTRKAIKDEFRQIKRKLINNAFGNASKTLNNSNLVMITSSKPNEGKTFVAINLALSLALEQDKTVLLIDADVLRPSVNRELGLTDVDGLMEYLLGEKQDIGDVIYRTNINKLNIVPAGKPHHLSNELLSSDKMHALANELAQRYPDRIVIFDCPPLLGVTETVVLSSLMGQALVVVEESKTHIADIKEATENLSDELALGLVLNKTIRSHKDKYGYYGYGYGYNS